MIENELFTLNPLVPFSASNSIILIFETILHHIYFDTLTVTHLQVTPSAVRSGMKLEAVDKKNFSPVSVATVADTLGEKILVHFDGWDNVYDYWCDISAPTIHPVGWCKDNGQTLSPPPG